ncbi:MAG: hypothetical protein HN909_08625 [Phycisphaerales bacterium]|jgi:hypothetical protein|nr:hypothetical protein [Phycisphaerales bacterium]MBT7171817.1 hypothetical protein [Phycisphaerales bacterium]
MPQPINEHHRILWQLLLAASHLPPLKLLPWVYSLQQQAVDETGQFPDDRSDMPEEFSQLLEALNRPKRTG